MRDGLKKVQIRQSLAALSNLRTYLWQGAAAAFVGAGFSRNAARKDISKPLPPEWEGLSYKFAQVLLGIDVIREMDENSIREYCKAKNPMMIAHECQAVFGRSTMIDAVKEMIDDGNLMPSKVHTALLKLNWSDVYTTNYDTLLERTAAGIREINYKIISNVDQIVGSSQPRIVKLHGTWEGRIEDWVVTDEDYRLYPRRFAPFVNMVRQSAMESCLCLIGFSGTDPNFLAWIGWVRDNLGNAGLPVYMLTDRTYSQGEYQWLASRRIIPINVFHVVDERFEGDYEAAFLEVFRYLDPGERKGSELPSRMAWGLIEEEAPDEKRTKLMDWVKAIEEYREVYQKWIVAPYSIRRRITTISKVLDCAFEIAFSLHADQRNRVIASLYWYYSLSLETIGDSLYKLLVKFWRTIKKENEKGEQIESPVLPLEIIDVIFGLTRAARERSDRELWDDVIGFLRGIKHLDLNRIYYEQVLMAMCEVDAGSIEQCIDEWREMEKSEEWKIKYASVLLIINRIDEAESVLENALKDIRSKTPRGNVATNRFYLSLEGITLVLLRQLNSRGKENAPMEWKTRLEELSEFQCNPLEELDKFGLMFGGSFAAQEKNVSVRNFDKKSEVKHYSYMPSEESILAGTFFHYLEETGIPFIISHKTFFGEDWLGKCIKWYLYHYVSNVATVNWLAVCFGESVMNLIYSERAVAKMSENIACKMMKQRLLYLRSFITSCGRVSTVDNAEFNRKVLAYSLEISSRLACRIFDAVLLGELLDLACEMFSINGANDQYQIRGIGPSFFRRVEAALPVEILIEKIPLLIKCVVHRTAFSHEYERLSSLEPLQQRKALEVDKLSQKVHNCIDNLFEALKTQIGDEKRDAVFALTYIECLGILSPKYRALLGCQLSALSDGNERILDELSISHLRHLFYGNKEGDKVIIHSYMRRMSRLSLDVVVHAEERYTYKDFSRTFGLRYADLDSHFDIYPNYGGLLCSHVVQRINKIAEGLNDCSIVGNDDVVEEIGNGLQWLDYIVGDVVIPFGCEQDIDAVVNLKEKIERDIDMKLLPLTSLSLYAKSQEWSEAVDYIRSYSLFDSPKELMRLLVSLEYFAHHISDTCPLTGEIEEFLALLFLNSRDTNFICVCRTIATWIVRFSERDKLVNAIFPGLKRMIYETAYDSSNRFPLEDLADYREAVAYLCGVISSVYENRSTGLHREIHAFVNMWRRLCESNTELCRVRRGWELGVNKRV